MIKTDVLKRTEGTPLVWIVALLAAVTPALLTFLFIHYHLNTSLTEFYPVRYLDQSDYWHEAFTYKEAGFEGGYYGQSEEITPLPWIHFGTHGPLYPILYGALARLTGWNFSTPIYINLALLAVGVLGFVLLARPKPYQALLLLLLMGSFAPMLYYVPTVLQESLQQAAALILAGMFADLFQRRDSVSALRKWIYFSFLFVLAVARFSWGILFLPFLFLALPNLGRSRRGWLPFGIYGAVSTALIGLVYWISVLVTAPGADTIVMTVDTLGASPLQGLKLVLTWLSANLAQLLHSDSVISLALRIQTLGLLIYATLLVIKTIRGRLPFADTDVRLGVFHLINILPLSLALFTIYFLETDVRVLGPHLLLSLALMIRFSQPRPFLILLLVSLLSYPYFLSEYRQLGASFTPDKERILLTQKVLAQKVVYNPSAPNPWCNTLLISAQYYYDTLLATPSGIGVTFIWPGRTKEMDLPLKSVYLILDDEKYERLRRTGKFEAFELALLPGGGRLYRNPLSACPLP